MTDADPVPGGSGGVGGPPPLPPSTVPAGYVPSQLAGGVPPAVANGSDGARALVAGTSPSSPAGPGPGALSPLLAGTPPVDRHRAGRWLLYAIIGFLVGQVLAAIFGQVAGSLAGKNAVQMKLITSEDVPPEWYVVSTLVGIWAGFLGAPWLASRIHGTRHFLSDLGVRFRTADLWGIFIGVGGQILVVVMYLPFRHDIHNFNAPSQKLTGSSHGGGFLVIALATVILAPFFEEVFFRGLLFKALVRLFTPAATVTPAAGRMMSRTAGIVAAVVLDGLLFGLAHGEWVQLAGLATFGMILAFVSLRTGRLGMNIVAHASFNLVAVITILNTRGGVIH